MSGIHTNLRTFEISWTIELHHYRILLTHFAPLEFWFIAFHYARFLSPIKKLHKSERSFDLSVRASSPFWVEEKACSCGAWFIPGIKNPRTFVSFLHALFCICFSCLLVSFTHKLIIAQIPQNTRTILPSVGGI